MAVLETDAAVSRRGFCAGLSAVTAFSTAARARGVPTRREGDIIDIYDENDTNLETAYKLGARAVLHETNFFRNSTGKSSKYKERKVAAKKLGMLWGAFTMMTNEPIDDQYHRLIDIEDFSDGQTLLALDWEEPGHGKSRASYGELKAFVERIQKEKSFFPLIYGSNFIKENGNLTKGDPFFARCPLWIAAPNVSAPAFPRNTWSRYTLWQYKFDDKTVSNADWSRYRGTFKEMTALWPKLV